MGFRIDETTIATQQLGAHAKRLCFVAESRAYTDFTFCLNPERLPFESDDREQSCLRLLQKQAGAQFPW